MKLYFATFAAALGASLCFTPLVRKLARRWNVVDRPDGDRKLHKSVTPLGGGVAVLVAFLVAVLTTLTVSPNQRAVLAEDKWFLIGGLSSAVAICLFGLFDDIYCLRGRQKLAGQLLAITLWLATGLWISEISFLSFNVALGLAAIPFTVFWLLGAINSLNLLDGADGLATGVGIVLSLSIGVIGVLTQHPTEALLSFAMSGALTGFLFFNRSPATIFLGDSGSMLIGLVLGALAIRGSMKGPATVALAAPLAIWAIPILDSAMAILRRKLTGQSIYTSDRGHLHHVVQRRGWPTAAFIGVLCAITSAGAICSVVLGDERVALASVGLVSLALVGTGIFGKHEVTLLSQRGKHFVDSMVPITANRGPNFSQFSQSEDAEKWEDLWQTLTEFAERFELSTVQLNIRLPARQHEYHANWSRKNRRGGAEFWTSEIPLTAGQMPVGRLKISGRYEGDNVCTWMGDLLIGLKPFESQLVELLEDDEANTPWLEPSCEPAGVRGEA